MYIAETAWRKVRERGPRYAVIGSLRPGEARCEYADTAEAAEVIRGRFESDHYYQVSLHPPVGAVDLAPLRAAREEARRSLDEATGLLRAGVLRALEQGRAEAEVARTAGLDRMTVRKWAGKDA